MGAAGAFEPHVVAEIAVVGTVVHTGLVVHTGPAAHTGPVAIAVESAHGSGQEEVEVEMIRCRFPCRKTVVIGVSPASAGW